MSDIDSELGMESGKDIVDKSTKFNILVPFRESYNFSTNCILCGSANATEKHKVTESFKSGEYVVAKRNTVLQFDGFRVCKQCYQRMKFTAKEWTVLGISIGIGIAIFAILLMLKIFFIVGCIISPIATFTVMALGMILSKSKVEGPPAAMKVMTEEKELGKIRPTGIVFQFRSKRAADEFASMNGGEEVDLKGGKLI